MKFTLEIDIEESTVMAGHYLGYVMERAASLLKLVDAEQATLATWDAFDRRGQARDAYDRIVGSWKIDSHASHVYECRKGHAMTCDICEDNEEPQRGIVHTYVADPEMEGGINEGLCQYCDEPKNRHRYKTLECLTTGQREFLKTHPENTTQR